MFPLQSFSTQKSGISDGNDANATGRIRSLLTKLLHHPETGVIALTSDEATDDMLHGNIVRISGAYSCTLAIGSDLPTQPLDVNGFAFCLTPIVHAGGIGYFRFAGEAEVQLEDFLTPVESEPVYVSRGSAGMLTNVAPVGASEWVRQMGIILDATRYDLTGKARILIEPCCPSQVLEH